jgi:hypothetical protein
VKGLQNRLIGFVIHVDFEVIDLVNSEDSYTALVGRPWGKRTRGSVWLNKNDLTFRGNGNEVIVCPDPSKGNM